MVQVVCTIRWRVTVGEKVKMFGKGIKLCIQVRILLLFHAENEGLSEPRTMFEAFFEAQLLYPSRAFQGLRRGAKLYGTSCINLFSVIRLHAFFLSVLYSWLACEQHTLLAWVSFCTINLLHIKSVFVTSLQCNFPFFVYSIWRSTAQNLLRGFLLESVCILWANGSLLFLRTSDSTLTGTTIKMCSGVSGVSQTLVSRAFKQLPNSMRLQQDICKIFQGMGEKATSWSSRRGRNERIWCNLRKRPPQLPTEPLNCKYNPTGRALFWQGQSILPHNGWLSQPP